MSRYYVPGCLLLTALASCNDPVTEPEQSPPAETAFAMSETALSFYQVSGGFDKTCGITTDSLAYCWGSGMLGDGREDQPPDRLRPSAVLGDLRFIQVSAASYDHMCGVTADNLAYCWGFNPHGELGDGTTTDRLTPVPVAGGRRFYHVEVGGFHTCGLSSPDKLVYCWGYNANGQLGDGSTTSHNTPVLVAGGRQFRQVSAGYLHSCGMTPTGPAYCWGSNQYGQTGDGDASTATKHLVPVLVAGGKLYNQLDAGTDHTCAVSTDHKAYCWGSGRSGQVGDGQAYLRFAPRAVAGGLSFERVSAGWNHTCGETTGNRAYCWGGNPRGELGDGTTTGRLTPVAVAGGLFFSQVTAGHTYSCGRTDTGEGYCWGLNMSGQLGDGTTTDRTTPTPIAGPM